MSVIVKGDSPFDAFIVSGIKGCQTEHIKFYNISFNCKTIEDADGRVFTRHEERKKGKWIIKAINTYELAYGTTAYEPVYECSSCRRVEESYLRLDEPIMPEDADFPEFCPHCGADMR